MVYSFRITLMVKIYISFLLLTLLSACSIAKQNISTIEVQKGSRETAITNYGSGYSLQVPKELFVWGSNNFFSTIAPPPTNEYPIYELNTANDYDVNVLNIPADSCSPLLLGTANLTDLQETNGKTVWGRVDEDTYAGNGNYRNSLCKYPVRKDCTKEIFWSKGCGGLGGGAYTFCSEKDNKRVIICISQAKDNPTVAKQVFSTFRWLDK